MDISIERVNSATQEVAELLAELDAALAGPYSADQRHAVSIDQLFVPSIRFFVARLDGVAVGCGGVAILDGYAEVKRMYTKSALRRQGIAAAVLRRIESEARASGATILRIETGAYQHESLKFYEHAGFCRRGPFGPYAEMPPHAIETSLFYEKSLQRRVQPSSTLSLPQAWLAYVLARIADQRITPAAEILPPARAREGSTPAVADAI
jgi:putative acetyltransferase